MQSLARQDNGGCYSSEEGSNKRMVTGSAKVIKRNIYILPVSSLQSAFHAR